MADHIVGTTPQLQRIDLSLAAATISTPAGKEGVEACLNAFRTELLYFYTVDGSSLRLDRWILNSSNVWANAGNLLTHTGTSPSIQRIGSGRISVCYIQTGTAKHCYYESSVGETHVQSIGSGTLVVHKIDGFGRMICAVYNSGWKVQVGTLGSDGVTWTFSSQVSMGITASERRGSIEFLDGGKISFAYIDGSSAAKLVICKNLDNSGNGSWL